MAVFCDGKTWQFACRGPNPIGKAHNCVPCEWIPQYLVSAPNKLCYRVPPYGAINFLSPPLSTSFPRPIFQPTGSFTPFSTPRSSSSNHSMLKQPGKAGFSARLSRDFISIPSDLQAPFCPDLEMSIFNSHS